MFIWEIEEHVFINYLSALSFTLHLRQHLKHLSADIPIRTYIVQSYPN